MATLNARLLALESRTSTAPMLTMCVNSEPTPEQQATIDHCTRTGRRLVVFYDPGNTAWMHGFGPPPWEGVQHGTT